jgi:diguanylate cyclase (GGDEF)-like protein/PAS domain S-box-containing protein
MTMQPVIQPAMVYDMLDSLQEALWLLNAQTLTVVYANAASESLTGFGAAQVRGQPVQVLAATPSQQAFWRDSLSRQARTPFLTQVRRADGRLVPVEMKVSPLGQGADGVLMLSMLDRREQARQEVDLEESLLSEQRATLESVAADLRLADRVFESSLDGMFIADAGQRIVRINPACARLLQGTEARGQVVSALFESDGGQVDQLGAWARAKWEQGGFWEGNLWLRLADGRRCAVWLSWVALRGDAGSEVVQSIGFMRDMTQQYRDRQRIEQLAYRDPLTDLPNRLALTMHVESAIAEASLLGSVLSILFVNLDRFKIINDSLGHEFGDRVLRLVARRLGTLMRSEDILCRLGGDEFVICLQGCDAERAASVAERVLREMQQPFMLDGLGFSVQCSIGAAQFPTDGLTLDELIRQADIAMHRVKERGRGHFSFYEPQMSAGLLSRMKLEHAMRQALDKGHMAVYYQPQVHIATDRIVAAEALVRWTDPEFGMVSPAVFIALAEESGYIVALGAWVLEQSVREAARWHARGTPLKVSVNVSALEFRQPDFVERLLQVLQHHGLPAHWLELELTESILLKDAQEMALRVRQIAELGVGLVIDDFGTGYSSMAYLKKLPISKIKVDQSFVRGLPQDEEDRAIVAAIISIGQALGVEVVAEGVETGEQCAAIHHMHGSYFQGYLCAPALPPEQLQQRLQVQHEQGVGAVAYSQSLGAPALSMPHQ